MWTCHKTSAFHVLWICEWHLSQINPLADACREVCLTPEVAWDFQRISRSFNCWIRLQILMVILLVSFSIGASEILNQQKNTQSPDSELKCWCKRRATIGFSRSLSLAMHLSSTQLFQYHYALSDWNPFKPSPSRSELKYKLTPRTMHHDWYSPQATVIHAKKCIDTVKSLQQLADIDPTCLHEMFPGSPLNGSFHHLPSYYPSDLVKHPPFVDGLYPEIWESSWIGPMLAPLITFGCQKSNIIHSCRWNSMLP